MKELEYPFDPRYILSKKKKIRRTLLEGSGGLSGQNSSMTNKRVAILGGSTTSDIKPVLELFLLKLCRSF